MATDCGGRCVRDDHGETEDRRFAVRRKVGECTNGLRLRVTQVDRVTVEPQSREEQERHSQKPDGGEQRKPWRLARQGGNATDSPVCFDVPLRRARAAG